MDGARLCFVWAAPPPSREALNCSLRGGGYVLWPCVQDLDLNVILPTFSSDRPLRTFRLDVKLEDPFAFVYTSGEPETGVVGGAPRCR